MDERAMSKDLVGLWFKHLETQGEYTHIPVGHITNDDQKNPNWHYLPHAKYDGITGIISILRKAGRIGSMSFPKMPRRDAPPSWIKLREFLKYSFRLPLRTRMWALENKEWKPVAGGGVLPPSQSWKVLTLEETSRIVAKSKMLGVTVNALLMAELDRAVRSKLKRSKRPTIWMIPVSVHQGDFATLEGMNESSFVDLYIREEMTAREIDRKLKHLYETQAHWGGWLGMRLLASLGSTVLGAFMRINPLLQPRTGAFTNLGTWQDRAQTVSGEAIVGYPPVLHYQPCGASALTWNSRLGLSLWLHPSLTTDPRVSAELVEAWSASLLAIS
jgi:hypothetical protein